MSETFLRASRVRAVDALGDEEDGTSCSVRMARPRMLDSEDEEVAERARATLHDIQRMARKRINRYLQDLGKEGIPNCSAGPVDGPVDPHAARGRGGRGHGGAWCAGQRRC